MRTFPHDPTGGRQKKNGHPKMAVLVQFGGGGRNRTAVRKHSAVGTTCLVGHLISPRRRGQTRCDRTSHLFLTCSPSDPGARDRSKCPRCDQPLPASHPGRALPGARSSGIKPPERTFRRSQLNLRLLVINEVKRLGMPRAVSQPPSKPVHPRNRWRGRLTNGSLALERSMITLRTHRSRWAHWLFTL